MAMIYCPECGREVSPRASTCPQCGYPLRERLHGETEPSRQEVVHVHEHRPSRGIAAVLSLIIPGAGQLYKGQVINGIVWFCLVSVGYFLLVIPGLILHALCIIGAAMGRPK